MKNKEFFDFNSEEQFNLDSEYEKIFNTESQEDVIELSENEQKIKDAENIINELGSLYLEGDSISKYEKSYYNIVQFFKKFKIDSTEVKEMTEKDRDKLFGYGKELFKDYQNKYQHLTFNFEISKKEWHFVYNTLTKRLSYDGKELFNYWELYGKFLQPTQNIATNLSKNVDSFVAIISIQSLVLLYHILMKHQEKASCDSFTYFRTVLGEIGKMTKLFNAYGVMLERISNNYSNWVNALNAMDGYNNDDRTK